MQVYYLDIPGNNDIWPTIPFTTKLYHNYTLSFSDAVPCLHVQSLVPLRILDFIGTAVDYCLLPHKAEEEIWNLRISTFQQKQ